MQMMKERSVLRFADRKIVRNLASVPVKPHFFLLLLFSTYAFHRVFFFNKSTSASFDTRYLSSINTTELKTQAHSDRCYGFIIDFIFLSCD